MQLPPSILQNGVARPVRDGGDEGARLFSRLGSDGLTLNDVQRLPEDGNFSIIQTSNGRRNATVKALLFRRGRGSFGRPL